MRLLVAGSLMLALIMSVFPIDTNWRWLRPEFVALMVIYWSLHAPEYFGLFTAWCLGLMQDILELGLLGQNALGLIILAYLCQLSCRRILRYTVWQQAACVCLLIMIYLSFDQWISSMTAYEGAKISFFLWSAPVSAFIWPLIVFLGEYLANTSTFYKNRD